MRFFRPHLGTVARIITALFLLGSPMALWGETPADKTSVKEKPESPWLLTPLISSGPKFGTSLGALGGYIHNFDDESPASMFGVMASYSNTESSVYGAFARTFFDQDRQRLVAGVVAGEVNNKYADFLGSGYEFKTTDNIHALFARYLYRIKHDWFFGAQALSTDYAISGNDWFSDAILDRIGLTGFDSNGLGLVLERDTRDNQNSPSSGSRFNMNNVAYRQSFGGDVSFDAYALSFSKYIGHGNGHVLAGRVNGRWTNNAPPSGYSTIMLRGYTMGQFLGRHSTLFEIEERLHIRGRWGATAFVGAACLYGDGKACDERTNWYPAAGAGITYVLKPEEKMIARAELAAGKGENFGFYMKFGYEF